MHLIILLRELNNEIEIQFFRIFRTIRKSENFLRRKRMNIMVKGPIFVGTWEPIVPFFKSGPAVFVQGVITHVPIIGAQ